MFKRLIQPIVLLLGILMVFMLLCAMSVRFSPVRLTFLQGQKTVQVIRILNPTDTPITFQAIPKLWSQKDGQNNYESTKAFIINPKIFTIKPGKKQIVRVGIPTIEANFLREKSYRLYFKQLPNNLGDAAGTGLRFLFQVSIPIFVVPAKVHEDLIWSFYKTKDQWCLKVINHSNVHIQVNHIQLKTMNGDQLFDKHDMVYVLPQQSANWPVSEDENTLLQKIRLIVDTDRGVKEQLLDLRNQ